MLMKRCSFGLWAKEIMDHSSMYPSISSISSCKIESKTMEAAYRIYLKCQSSNLRWIKILLWAVQKDWCHHLRIEHLDTSKIMLSILALDRTNHQVKTWFECVQFRRKKSLIKRARKSTKKWTAIYSRAWNSQKAKKE